MIKQVRKKAKPINVLTPDEYEQHTRGAGNSTYYLIENEEDASIFDIYWKAESGPMSPLSRSSQKYAIMYENIPFSDIIVLTYGEIKSIHHGSKYVEIQDIEDYITKNSYTDSLGISHD